MNRREKKSVLRYESTRDLEHTRNALLEAGARVFAEKGLAGTRVDDLVAASGGVNRSMIYYIFGSKQQLYREVLRSIVEGLRESALQSLATDSVSKSILSSVVLAMSRVFSEQPDWARLLLREIIDGGGDLRAIVSAAPDWHLPKREALSLLSRTRGNQLFEEDNAYAFVLFVQVIPFILPVAGPILDVMFPDGEHTRISKESWQNFVTRMLELFVEPVTELES